MRLVNGATAESLPLADRALQFGDGVFRTIKMIKGQPQFWSRHYRKLCADCTALGIEAPDESTLRDEIGLLYVNSGFADATIKIIISRGESARGYAIPAGITPRRIVQIAPLHSYPESLYTQGACIRLCTMRASWQPALAGIKHLNRLENVLARREWNDPAILDGLLLDRDGMVIEGVMSNVLIKQGTALVTPDLSSAGVAGVMRDVAMAAARRLGWQVNVQPISLDELRAADSVWLCNSLIGLMPVRQMDDTYWLPNRDLVHAATEISKEENP
jgi:4-amino-4-deoxychorismate lyase